jgi:hypothetical protein
MNIDVTKEPRSPIDSEILDICNIVFDVLWTLFEVAVQGPSAALIDNGGSQTLDVLEAFVLTFDKALSGFAGRNHLFPAGAFQEVKSTG